MPAHDYDLFVIGGGSGGVRSARLTASLGKRVGIAESYRFGGTCVIRGCVPKKLLVYASQYPEQAEDARGYGWSVPDAAFSWPALIAAKDKEIERLEALYARGVEKAGGETFTTHATLLDPHTIRLESENRTVTADQILLAVGGRPNPHTEMPGHELCILSDDAFHLPELPRRIVIAGAGYIAVEFANIFHGLGAEVTLVLRGHEILRGFDDDLRRLLQEAMENKGIAIRTGTEIGRVERVGNHALSAVLKNGEALEADQVMLALGRLPNTGGLGLEAAGVETGETGEIKVDAFSRTNVENIWAVGDVTDRVQLTPVAIHEGVCFVETAFKNNPTRPDHDLIATAVFSQPEIGTVGLTERQAAETLDEVEVYRAHFRPLRHTLTGRDEKILTKLVVDAATRRVVGAHILGPEAGELAQLLGIAVKGRLTKDDFDRTMAVHPSAAEELVTMYTPTYRIRHGERLAA